MLTENTDKMQTGPYDCVAQHSVQLNQFYVFNHHYTEIRTLNLIIIPDLECQLFI